MAFLMFIRHAETLRLPDVPAREWPLSPQGEVSAHQLAETLRAKKHVPDVLLLSEVPKAAQTGQILAAAWEKPAKIWPDLHEHRRDQVAFDAKAFHEGVARFFAQPNRLVFGEETANQVHSRFTDAVKRGMNEHPGQSLAIVAHGTVITLFLCRLLGLEPLTFWQSLTLPDYRILSLPQMQLLED